MMRQTGAFFLILCLFLSQDVYSGARIPNVELVEKLKTALDKYEAVLFEISKTQNLSKCKKLIVNNSPWYQQMIRWKKEGDFVLPRLYGQFMMHTPPFISLIIMKGILNDNRANIQIQSHMNHITFKMPYMNIQADYIEGDLQLYDFFIEDYDIFLNGVPNF